MAVFLSSSRGGVQGRGRVLQPKGEPEIRGFRGGGSPQGPTMAGWVEIGPGKLSPVEQEGCDPGLCVRQVGPHPARWKKRVGIWGGRKRHFRAQIRVPPSTSVKDPSSILGDPASAREKTVLQDFIGEGDDHDRVGGARKYGRGSQTFPLIKQH